MLIVLLQGIKIAALEQSWLVIVRIVLYPSDTGRSVIKSIAIVWKGSGFGSLVIGKIAGLLGFVLVFVIWQVAHPLMYSVTWLRMPGHQ